MFGGYKATRRRQGTRTIIKQSIVRPGLSCKCPLWITYGLLMDFVAESFFHSLKTELVCEQVYKNRSVARQEIFKYIEIFYNRKRRHSTLDYKSPLDFEMLNVA
jgi:putative transposase